VGQIKRLVASQFREPEVDWVRFFTTRVYDGQFTQRVREQFTPLVMKATKQFLNDQVNDRLKSALGSEEYGYEESGTADGSGTNTAPPGEEPNEPKPLEVTSDELEGHRIVTAIVCSEVQPSRVAKRKGKSHFSVLLDDSNRKPLARLYLGGRQDYIGLFDADKNETRVAINSRADIYDYAEHLRETVHHYDR
jgi:hypothetical protein